MKKDLVIRTRGARAQRDPDVKLLSSDVCDGWIDVVVNLQMTWILTHKKIKLKRSKAEIDQCRVENYFRIEKRVREDPVVKMFVV